MAVYQFLNIFLFIFHTVFTLFNIVGWAFTKTRKLHLITLSQQLSPGLYWVSGMAGGIAFVPTGTGR
jgi:hypothetical protein